MRDPYLCEVDDPYRVFIGFHSFVSISSIPILKVHNFVNQRQSLNSRKQNEDEVSLTRIGKTI